MHPNQIFRKTPQDRNIEFAKYRSFGTLAINADMGPLISHIPFQLSNDGKHLEAHLVRSNPILRLLETEQNAAVSIMGGDAYISPDWYGIDDQVPTWNYIAVHLRGKMRKLPEDRLHGILERISADMENRLSPKAPWKIDKMTPEIYEKMKRQIVPIEMDVSQIDGTWKLSQNKPEAAIKGALEGLEGAALGSEIGHLRQIMLAENDM